MSQASKGFVHLHNHLEGSYSDSALRVTKALDRVKELDMSAFAVTDHGELGTIPLFVSEAVKRNIKPIIGMEVYFVEDARANISKRINDRYHLTLIAANSEGWRNLVSIASYSWSQNCLMQKLGLVDWRLLEKYERGIICLSGCLAGPIGWSAIKDNFKEADRFFGRLSDIFQDRFYLEVYRHGLSDEEKAVKYINVLAERYQHKVVLANDCHYMFQDEWVLHDTIIKTRFGKATEFELKMHEYYIKSAEEMRSLGFPSEYCDRTFEIAERTEIKESDIFSSADNGEYQFAFLKKAKPITMNKAYEKAASALRISSAEQKKISSMPEDEIKKSYPEVMKIAKGIQGLMQKPEPDLMKVVKAKRLFSRIPVRKAENAVFTMWDEDDCRRAGAEIISIDNCMELQSISKSTLSYFKGLDAHKKRKFDKAKKYFTEAISFDPAFSNAQYQLALSEFYSGNYQLCYNLLTNLLKKNPGFERLPHLFSYLGWCCYHLNNDDESEQAFLSSIAEKEIPGSFLGLGLLYERKGKFDDARKYLLKMIEISPTDSKIEEAHNALERLSSIKTGL